MDVETATAAGHAEHKGRTHHFCSGGCKKKFDLDPDPEQFAGKSAKTPKAGTANGW